MASGSSSEKSADDIFMDTLEKKNSSNTNGQGLVRVAAMWNGWQWGVDRKGAQNDFDMSSIW